MSELLNDIKEYLDNACRVDENAWENNESECCVCGTSERDDDGSFLHDEGCVIGDAWSLASRLWAYRQQQSHEA